MGSEPAGRGDPLTIRERRSRDRGAPDGSCDRSRTPSTGARQARPEKVAVVDEIRAKLG